MGLMEKKNQRLEDLSLKGERRLWLSGGSSARARDGLAKVGWSVRSKVLWEHAGTVCSPVVSKVSVSANQPWAVEIPILLSANEKSCRARAAVKSHRQHFGSE